MADELECGSSCCGRLAAGCRHCIQGSKMVLFVTGRCRRGCFYCPVSLEKKGRDVIYANEARVRTDEEIVAEAEAMDATGTGITGGDPLEDMDRTLHMIAMLKERFGEGHHIHLYTGTIDADKAKRLEEAGLDEIRFHPPESAWTDMDGTGLAGIAASSGMDVGVEVPALPGMGTELAALVSWCGVNGVGFVNINELEFSESNWDMMDAHSYSLKDELSSAVDGSEAAARFAMERNPDVNVHFCSSAFKDGVQLRRRLIRTAEHVATDYQAITDDGTVVRGFVYGDPDLIAGELLAMGVPEDMMAKLDGKLEVAPWILDGSAEDIPHPCYISEQYPTADRLEVERTRLNREEPASRRL